MGVEEVYAANPTLTWRGWWGLWHELNEPLELLGQLREETLMPHRVAQYYTAVKFLIEYEKYKIKICNRKYSTYRWKHRVEGWGRKMGDPKCYVGEGSFIGACIACGFTIKRMDRFTFVNLGNRAYTD